MNQREDKELYLHSWSDELDEYSGFILERIPYYRGRAELYKLIHHTIQVIIIVGATSVPFLLNIPDTPKALPTVISGIVAVAVAVANYFKFGERSRSLFLASESLAKEKTAQAYGTGLYKGLEEKETYLLFRERTQAITLEQKMQSFSFGESKIKAHHE